MELVIGILVSAIAIVLLTSVLFPQADKAADSLQRVRSAELAHSIMNEIWGKRYDNASGANGGLPACNSAGAPSCTDEADFGPEAGKSRDDYDDVDDYHGLNASSLMLQSSASYQDVYPNYGLAVSVSYLDATQAQKLVEVTVTTPNGEPISYSAIRSNY
ncbi:MSHA biogenesis protein MshD [Paraferrimonas sedimenticola]|uniref:MSHA biogenesis protein MshD n=2 Tax=Paraferrimonas sedimenticola TaxID=375674 RepID=A0AA37VZ35_9GAMM|nr:MSHA biogenesis protein MshD [Paraferrimonas sedimenticola]